MSRLAHPAAGITILLAILAANGTGWALDPPPSADPSATGGPADPGTAPAVEIPPPTPASPERAADGTTSVVVPQTAPPPTASNAPPQPVPLQPGVPVRPANQAGGGTPPTTPSASAQPAPQSDAANLLARTLEPLAATPGRTVGAQEAILYSRPLQLLEALGRSGDRSRRLWIVQAYWKVSAAYAAVRCATEAFERLELVAPGADPHDRATLDVATAGARADLAEARARLAAAQQELVDLARLPIGEPAPWPVDRPLADPYQTHFEAIFANRIATGRVRAIVRGLPSRHEAVAARTTAVTAAEKAMTMAEADHAKGKRPIEAVVAAHAALVDQQERFLEAVRTYNLEIAEYAMAVAELALPDDQFVSMLIGTPIQWRPSGPVGEVLPAAATTPLPPVGQPPTE